MKTIRSVHFQDIYLYVIVFTYFILTFKTLYTGILYKSIGHIENDMSHNILSAAFPIYREHIYT